MLYSLKVQFEPWVGPKYDTGIAGKKVLVLGESHYHDCERGGDACNSLDATERAVRHRKLTISEVDWWKDKPHSTPLSTALPKLFEMTKGEFWRSIAFYNYVQEFMSAARVRPSTDAWAAPQSVVALQEVLDTLEPDRILVLGKDLWSLLPSDAAFLACRPIPEQSLILPEKVGNRNTVDGIAYWYGCHSGHLSLAMPVIHPSSWGFRAADWTGPVRRWLAIRDRR